MTGAAPSHDLRERLRAQALSAGFSRCGFTTAEPLGETVNRRRRDWLADGRAGAMAYLERASPRRTHPTDLLPEARTAIVVLAGYFDGNHEEMRSAECGTRKKGGSDAAARPQGRALQGETGDERDAGVVGKVARYAWGMDYHDVMREKLTQLGAWLAREAALAGFIEREADLALRPCVDSAPLDERALAVRAGLGFIGKNTLLLAPDDGSWSLIGALLTSLALPPDAPLAPAPAHSCGNCRRCIEACPTGAIDAPYRLDPRRCISYLTIEQKEPIPADLAANMRDWVFGCDLCQEVCPYNDAPLARLLPELAAEKGVGPWLTDATVEATPTGKGFARRWGHTPLARPGLKGLRRSIAALRETENSKDASKPNPL